MKKGRASWRAIAIAAACGLVSPRPGTPFDCDQNGAEDFGEVLGGAAPDCDGNGIPDACDVEPLNHGLAASQSLALGSAASSLISADLDGDGALDLAVALPDEASVSVFWADGSGGFTSEPRHLLGRAAVSLAAGDLGGDGLLDLVTGGPGGLAIIHQSAPRRLLILTPPPEAAESTRGSVALADLDGDGDLDVAFAARFEVLVLLNEGAWRFSEPTSVPAGSGPVHLIAPDLDGDGDADIATANFLPDDPSGSVSVFLNRGDGTLLAGRNFAVGSAPASLGAGDIDGDGRLDLVTANAGSSDISILIGAGNGAFTPLPRTPVPGAVHSAAPADLDLDGDLDLAVAGAEPQFDNVGIVSVHWNHGGDVLLRAFTVRTGGILGAIGIRDLHGDPSPEVFVAEANQGWIHVLEKALVAHHEDCDRNGIPDPCEVAGRDCNKNGLVDACDLSRGSSQDCDRDGLPDECESDCNSNEVPDDCDLALGTSPDCNGNSVPDECDIRSRSFGFEESAVGAAGEGLGLLIARDLDADGRPDLAGVDGLNRVLVHWNEGDGTLAPAKLAADAGPKASLAAGDIDGDGDLDLLAGSPGSRTLHVFVQPRPRAFSRGVEVLLPESPTSLAAADLDGDGLADTAAVTESGGIILLAGREEGTVGPERSGPRGVAPHSIAAADVDGDGARDLAAILSSGAPAIFWNRGDASFDEHAELSTAFFLQTLAIEDIDGDGDLDVAAADAGNVILFHQVGRRAFERAGHIRGLDLRGLAAADLDRDGLADIAVAQTGFFEGGIAVYLQRSAGLFDAGSPIAPLGGFGAIAAADFDGDGGTDLAASLNPCPLCGSASSVILLRNLTIPASSQDVNGDFRPDDCDPGAFRRGDADGDGALDLADAVFTLRSLFQGGPAPGCAEAADLDNDGSVNVTDPVSILELLFRGGPPPAAPGPPPGPCGLDPDPPGSPAHLGCAIYESC